MRCRTHAAHGALWHPMNSSFFGGRHEEDDAKQPSARAEPADQLMTGGAAVITDNEARYIHRLEVRQGETC